MKKIFFVTLFFVPLLTNAQKKGDNTIIIDTPITAAYLKSVLFDNNYFVNNTDTTIIFTEQTNLNHLSVYRLIFKLSKEKVIVKGEWKFTSDIKLWGSSMKTEYETVSYVKSKNNTFHQVFEKMIEIANKISSKITILKQ